MDEGILAAAAQAAGLTGLRAVARLPGHARNQVWRVTDDDASFVVKAYADLEGEGWAREPAALEALAGSRAAPELLGVLDDPRLVVMEDLGRAPHVADALLGSDPARAVTALEGWVDALARLHLAGDDAVLDTFGRRLGARSAEMGTHWMPEHLAGAARTHGSIAGRLGLRMPEEVANALADLASGFAVSAVALTPGDTCPDNNVVLPDGVRLLDFEGAEIRHLVWDVAYLRVPWPTCWCAWRIPSELTDRLVRRYRERVAPSLAYVGTEPFRADLDRATLGWCLASAAWFLPGALDDAVADASLGDGPGRRTTLMHRLWLAAHLPVGDDLAELTTYARDLYRTLARRWGEPTLLLAPAFREGDIAIP